MHLYSFTVQRPSAITAAAICTFAPRKQCLVIARGSWLEVWEPNPETSQLHRQGDTNVFAAIRAIAPFRVGGMASDHVLVTSDAGNMVVLSYELSSRRFVQIHCEPYGRSGVRRTVPGEYLTVDPHGRASMIASIEKSRLLYVLNRDEHQAVTISSPIEAHAAANTFCYGLVALDVGYANPAFLALERGPTNSAKVATLYELNLGLNTVVRRWSHEVLDTSDILIALPNRRDGTSGVLICAETRIVQLGVNDGIEKGRVDLPQDVGEVGCATVHRLADTKFFVLVQTTKGFLFKIEFEDGDIQKTQYFGCCPPSTFLGIFSDGFLWCAAEYGQHILYQFSSLEGQDLNSSWKPNSDDLELLVEVDRAPLAAMPLTSSILQHRQLLVGSGRQLDGAALKRIESGLEVEELAESELPQVPDRVFTLRRRREDIHDSFIVLSLVSGSTLVLALGADGSVNEADKSPLARNVRTLGAQQVGEDSVVQICIDRIRHVAISDKVTEWKPPGNVHVVTYAATNSHILLGLSNNDLVLFAVDSEGMLIEFQRPLSLGKPPTALSISGRRAVVATDDATLRVLSLEDERPLKVLALQALESPAASVLILGSCIYMGLSSGMLMTGSLDVDGRISGVRTRVLGAEPVNLQRIDDEKGLALAARPWLLFSPHSSVIALASPKLSAASSFSSADCEQGGVVAINDRVLRIFAVNPGREPVRLHPRETAGFTPFELVRNTFSSYIYAVGTSNDRTKSAIIVSPPKEDLDSELFLLSDPLNGAIAAACNVRFDSHNGKEFLVLATDSGHVAVYNYVGTPIGSALELVHTTVIPGCRALTPFKGRLLAGSRSAVFLLELGRKQLLRKAYTEIEGFTSIRSLGVARNHIFVGDARHSVALVAFSDTSQSFLVVAGDRAPRTVTALQVLDPRTVCIGDKFGTISVFRCPEHLAVQTSHPDGFSLLAARTRSKSKIVGPIFELELVAQFYVQDAITSLHRGSLAVLPGFDAIIWTGIQGTVGVLLPISGTEYQLLTDIAVQVLELEPSTVGRSHAAFRGYYAPVKSVVDGDLCEQFWKLTHDQKNAVCSALDVSVDEIAQTLLELRTRCAF